MTAHTTISGVGNMLDADTTIYGGEIYTQRRPKNSNTIICFKEKNKNIPFLFDARFIKDTIRHKYNIEEPVPAIAASPVVNNASKPLIK